MSSAPSRLSLLVVPTALFAGLGAAITVAVLPLPLPWLPPLMLALLVVSYAQLAVSAFGPLLGVAARAPLETGLETGPETGQDAPAWRPRTALLVPIYNEPPEPVAATIRIMAEALDPADRVAVFVLSDTQSPAVAAGEAELFPALAMARSGVEVHYRRRPRNTGRKAGNIAEFCANAGRGYDFAIVLDADSLMTADAIRALILAMAGDARCGLIQSVSYAVGGRTLFARMQQFAGRLGTPLAVAGQHLWQGRRGTYWGHNAILRLSAFTSDAVLPVLPGQAPMGGEILCHDTIEAALLLRAGWEVRLAPAITGSYETTPSNIIDHLARERRWCQGNMQHLRLIAAPRLRPESRVHIGIGILHYLVSPAGLLVSALLLGASLLPGIRATPPAGLVEALAWFSAALLFGPRLLSLARALLLPGAARGFGGRGRLLASALVEQVATALLAPVLAVSVTGFVLNTLAGRVVSWDAPARGDRPVGPREAWRRLRWHTAIGMGLFAALALAQPGALPWAMPFLLGLIFAVPAAVCSGSVRLGELARRLGLFLTEDELTPTAELAALSAFERAATRPRTLAPEWHPAPLPYRTSALQASSAAE